MPPALVTDPPVPHVVTLAFHTPSEAALATFAAAASAAAPRASAVGSTAAASEVSDITATAATAAATAVAAEAAEVAAMAGRARLHAWILRRRSRQCASWPTAQKQAQTQTRAPPAMLLSAASA